MIDLSLCVVIVNWNSGSLLSGCLKSLSQTRFASSTRVQVVVVDNDSSDASCDASDESTVADSKVILLRNGSNLGFAAACNLGAQFYIENFGTPDFVLFLNPDTRVYEDTFERLFQCEALRDQTYGIFGVQLVDDDGVAISCSNFPSLLNFAARLLGLSRWARGYEPALHHLSTFDHRVDRTVDQVMGAFFLVRGPLFRELEGFDAQFFVYFEEVDFCLRAKQTGRLTRFLASSNAYHQGRGTTESVKGFRQYLSVSSRLRYFRKNRSRIEYLAVLALSFGIEPLARFTLLAVRGQFRQLADLMSGYRRFIVDGIR